MSGHCALADLLSGVGVTLRLGRLLRPGADPHPAHRVQVAAWHVPWRVDAESYRLCDEQATTLDTSEPQRRVWLMQELTHTQTPEVMRTYPGYLRALRHG